MASYEASAVSRGDPEAVWSAWTAVASWSASDHIESASIDGEFRAGAVVKSKARGFPASTLTVTRVDRPTLWVDESRSPGMRMTFDHIIAPTADVDCSTPSPTLPEWKTSRENTVSIV